MSVRTGAMIASYLKGGFQEVLGHELRIYKDTATLCFSDFSVERPIKEPDLPFTIEWVVLDKQVYNRQALEHIKESIISNGAFEELTILTLCNTACPILFFKSREFDHFGLLGLFGVGD